MPRGLLLLKLEVLADALFNSGAAQRGPYAASRRDHGMRDLRVRGGIPSNSATTHSLSFAELAGDLTQVIALLPALQSVAAAGSCAAFWADAAPSAGAWRSPRSNVESKAVCDRTPGPEAASRRY